MKFLKVVHKIYDHKQKLFCGQVLIYVDMFWFMWKGNYLCGQVLTLWLKIMHFCIIKRFLCIFKFLMIQKEKPARVYRVFPNKIIFTNYNLFRYFLLLFKTLLMFLVTLEHKSTLYKVTRIKLLSVKSFKKLKYYF